MLLSLFAKSTGQQNINSNSKLIEIEQFVCLKVEKYEKNLQMSFDVIDDDI